MVLIVETHEAAAKDRVWGPTLQIYTDLSGKRIVTNGIQRLFEQVPQTYEMINHILTFGFDIRWRKKAAKKAVADGGTRWIDVCSGTGEMAVYLARLAKNGTLLYAADFSLPMLREAKAKPEGKYIDFSISEIQALPFPDEMFDLITISFATRNINTGYDDLLRSFKELHRILKPRGRLINLETSQPPNALLRRLFHLYIKTFVNPIGWRISGSKAAYAYLSQTIPRFYDEDELEEILQEAGFAHVEVDRLLFGVAAIHKAMR